MKFALPTGLFLSALTSAAIWSIDTRVDAGTEPDSGANPSVDPLFSKGLLDVTRFGAGPDDDVDDTVAIQQAMDSARDKGLVAYFPGGVYLISETLRAVQQVTFDDAKGRWTQNRRAANALTGVAIGKRPTLKLTEGARGFDDPKAPKPLVWIWSQSKNLGRRGSLRPEDEQPNISFNQVFKGIDIDLRGAGHAGAVGIRHAGSQGSTLEDVTIWAEGAFAGVYNPPGQGGGVYKLTVNGGRYGVWADHEARYPVLAGIALINQDDSAVFWKGQSNLTLAGFLIDKSKAGSVIEQQPGQRSHTRALTLVDGVIRGNGGLAVDNRNGRNLYIKDVYVSGSMYAVESRGKPAIARDGSVLKIKEYSYTAQGSKAIAAGQIQDAGFESVLVDAAPAVPSAEVLIERHLWGRSFPSFEDSDAISIADFGARGDDDVDDTLAIKSAVAKHPKVFIPKGTFVVSDTIRLGPESHLFGVAKHLSIIRCSSGWKGAPGNPVISTQDDAGAMTTLSFLMIERPANLPSVPLIEWRAGRKSVVRDVVGGRSDHPSRGDPRNAESKAFGTFAIRGNGGGRWYGLAAEWNRMSPDTGVAGYRHLTIEGTREPLAMYGLNIERGLSDPQMEIRNASNVAIFYLKGETAAGDAPKAGVMAINNSINIAVFGYSGNAHPWKSSVIRVAGSSDVVLANILPVRPEGMFDTVSVQEQANTLVINGIFPVALVRIGQQQLSF